MHENNLIEWMRDSLNLLEQDNHLLEHDVGERAITSKLGCYLQMKQPVYGLGLAQGERWQVDCEYNRVGRRPKQIPWNSLIVEEETMNTFYSPIPDIVVHRRGEAGPHLLVIEAKKETNANSFLELIDRLKLVAFLMSTLEYKFGLYLEVAGGTNKPKLTKADLLRGKTVRTCIEQNQALWDSATKHVTEEAPDEKVVLRSRRDISANKVETDRLCRNIYDAFAFEDIRSKLV